MLMEVLAGTPGEIDRYLDREATYCWGQQGQGYRPGRQSAPVDAGVVRFKEDAGCLR